MDFASRVVVIGTLVVACGQDRIEVSHDEAHDYNHGELQAAVDKFVTAGRTPRAYAELARTTLALRPGMDRSTAEQAELRLVVLALAPIRSVAALPIDDQVDALALTVWPTLLAPPIEADGILRRRESAPAVLPRPDEAPRPYLERLCGRQLAADCKQVVPEHQGTVISALATRRATERARGAVADCLICTTDKA